MSGISKSRWLVVLLVALALSVGACGDDDDDDDNDTAVGDDDDDDDNDDDNDDNNDDDDDDVTPPDALLGVYGVSGVDDQWGEFSGEAEIRVADDGKSLSFVRVVQFASAEFEGEAVASAWDGAIDGDEAGFAATAQLARIGFVDEYDGFVRDLQQTEPLTVTAEFAPGDDEGFSGAFIGADTVGTTETWVYDRESAAGPIWRNQRRLVATHNPIPDGMKNLLFSLFGSFHDRPEVQPYVDRADFQEAIHSIWIDHTDFDFYRANPNVLRVIEKVIDPISLFETRLRNRAFRLTLGEKAALLDQNMHAEHINDVGFINNSWWDGGELHFDPDMSTMLWTGVYIGSQAMRYLNTSETQALEHVVTGVEAQLLAYDVVPEIGQFARSVRAHAEPLPGDWVRGEGAYDGYDYLPGGNNDMLHGYQVGFTFAHLAMPGGEPYDSLRENMIRVLDELEQYHEDAGDNSINELKMNMILCLMTGEEGYRDRYRQLLNNVLYDFFIEQLGNGSFYIWSISDWSGNHLNVQSMIVMTLIAEALDDPSLPELQAGCRRSYVMMHGPRIPFFMNAMLALGWTDPDPERVEEGLWRLREFRAPKEHINIDWRINPEFSLSPFPELPWKFDWATGDRLSGLYGYPYFEQATGHFWLRSAPLDNYYDRANETSEISAGYLYLYWLLVDRGIIAGTE